MDNCFELKMRPPMLRRWFVYFDDWNYSADSLFNRYQIPIKFKGSWERDGDKYIVICCKVRRKDVPKFEQAMEDLKVKMLLIGNTDYASFCESLMKKLEKIRGN